MTPASEPRPHHPAGDQPLSPAQIEQMAAAEARAGKLRGAAKAAAFTGWTVGGFGVLSLLFGLGSITSAVVGAALVAVAWNEFQGRRLLLRFDPAGPRRLAANQLWLLIVIALYCLWSIYQIRTNPSAGTLQLENALGLDQDFVAGLVSAVYMVVLVVAAIFQYVMYRYHAARSTLLEQYLAETPPWIVEVQRSMRG